jgi:hypothetical protein
MNLFWSWTRTMQKTVNFLALQLQIHPSHEY